MNSYPLAKILQEWQFAQSEAHPGKARVYARRAIGWATNRWLQAHETHPAISALQNLRLLQQHPQFPAELQPALAQMVRQVNLDHDVPGDQPFLQSAQALLEFLTAPV